MLKRFGGTYARLVGLVIAALGTWVVLVNVAERSYSGWTLGWILVSGIFGAVGGVTYLLTLEGHERLRRLTVRRWAWLGMLIMALLPWSFQFVVLPMVLLTVPTLVGSGNAVSHSA